MGAARVEARSDGGETVVQLVPRAKPAKTATKRGDHPVHLVCEDADEGDPYAECGDEYEGARYATGFHEVTCVRCLRAQLTRERRDASDAARAARALAEFRAAVSALVDLGRFRLARERGGHHSVEVADRLDEIRRDALRRIDAIELHALGD